MLLSCSGLQAGEEAVEMDGPCLCPGDTLDDERCCGGAAPFPGLWKRRQLLSWERMEGHREGTLGLSQEE